ncbi:MAG: hypothetical protein EPN38_07430 [Rhodanobacteraceae bacterium]|nr:MAG: hypothetical protein EPN38_07430 [Rhodanobacteraceae bacterium]
MIEATTIVRHPSTISESAIMFKSAAFKVVRDQRLHCSSCKQRVIRIVKNLMGARKDQPA